jgi:hypothetical protein
MCGETAMICRRKNHNTKMDKKTFEDAANFRYLGTTVTGQNCINDEMKSRLISGNAW